MPLLKIVVTIACSAAMAWWAGYRLPRHHSASRAAYAVSIPPPAIAQYRPAQNTGPIVVLMTADWCEPCRVLEKDWQRHVAAARNTGSQTAPLLVLLHSDNPPHNVRRGAQIELDTVALGRVSGLQPPLFPTVWELDERGAVSFFRIGYDGSARERSDDRALLLR